MLLRLHSILRVDWPLEALHLPSTACHRRCSSPAPPIQAPSIRCSTTTSPVLRCTVLGCAAHRSHRVSLSVRPLCNSGSVRFRGARTYSDVHVLGIQDRGNVIDGAMVGVCKEVTIEMLVYIPEFKGRAQEDADLLCW
jgi:hypothetical protein